MSAAAGRSIRNFSIVTWVVGTIVAIVLAFVLLPNYLINEQTGGIGYFGNDERNPWSADAPREFERDGAVWHGSGSGFVRLTADDDEPLELRADQLQAFTTFRISASSQLELPANERELPESLGYLSEVGETTLVVPPGEATELWIQTQGDWRFSTKTIETTPIDGTLTGSGNAYLAYRGDALSGRFEHHGSGIFFVTIASVASEERPIIETDDVDQRLSWDAAPLVVFVIQADTGDGEWTVTIDRLADDDDTEPPPSETPDPESTPAAAAVIDFPSTSTTRTEPM